MYHPASIRSGLLIDSDSTSRYGWSFERSGGMLYTQPMTHRPAMVKPKGTLIGNAIPMPRIASASHWTYATRTFTLPDGTGRDRLIGCDRSDGASRTSL